MSARSGRYPAGIGTSLFVLGVGDNIYYYGTSGSAGAHVYIDPADWGSSGVILRIRGWAQTEADPADSTLTVGLARLTTVGAGGTIGGAALGITTPATMSPNAASSIYQGVSSGETVTTAAWYFAYFQHSVNPAQAMTYGYTLMGKAAL